MFCCEGASHGFCESFGYGQAEADTGGLRDVVEPLEGAEHFQDAFCRHSPAVIDDAEFPGRMARQGFVAQTAGSADDDDVGAGRVLDGVFDDVRDDSFEHAGVGVDFGHVRGQVDADAACRGAVQGCGDHVGPAHRTQKGLDCVRGDAGHIEQVPYEQVQPIGAFVNRLEQFLFLFLGIANAFLQEAANREFDSSKRRAEVVGDRAQDRGAHSVALGQAEDLPAAGGQLPALKLRGEMHAEHRKQ
ncbi:hypothetical protein AHiyo6_07510, partial [Arthrobacter sp. Hiyo6]